MDETQETHGYKECGHPLWRDTAGGQMPYECDCTPAWRDFGDCTCGKSVYHAMNGLWYHADPKPTGTMTIACTQDPANQR